MIENNTTIQPERVRVSIFERIVPFASLALAALGGAAGGWAIISVITAIRQSETAGIGAVATGLAEMGMLPLVFLYGAAALGVVAICVAIGRLVIQTKTASPSGISYLVLGILSLVPAAFAWQAGSIIISLLDGTTEYGLGESGSAVASYCWATLISTPVVLFVLLAWSLIPFKAKPGRRFGPLICLILVEILLVTVAVAFQLRIQGLYTLGNAS